MQPIRPDASVAALGVALFAKCEVRGRSAMPSAPARTRRAAMNG